MVNNGEHPFVESRENVVYVRGSRVPLGPLVWLWRDGGSAKTIREAYPALRLADVYGALTYSLDLQAEVDLPLAESLAHCAARRAAADPADPVRYAALRQRCAGASRLTASINRHRRL